MARHTPSDLDCKDRDAHLARLRDPQPGRTPVAARRVDPVRHNPACPAVYAYSAGHGPCLCDIGKSLPSGGYR